MYMYMYHCAFGTVHVVRLIIAGNGGCVRGRLNIRFIAFFMVIHHLCERERQRGGWGERQREIERGGRESVSQSVSMSTQLPTDIIQFSKILITDRLRETEGERERT